ncbi:hypothetical protein Tco_1124986 [Tanacetum coccineum]|uniref:Uncharacterized protein n=1 Tax=Tanacetum coccineum TaxID=301880 RepID=A0ABQ5J8U7_9ASTR
MIHPQSSHMIHPQSSQVIHPQSSQALAISLQSSADPLQFDSGLVVLYFLPTNDPLECLNKALAFMCTTLASSYPSYNNQLETSSNLMNQVDMQGRQTHSYVGNFSNDTGDKVDSHPSAYSLTTNPIFQPDGIDLYDSNCDDISTAKAVLMSNLSSYGSDVLFEVPHSETYQNDMANQSVQAMQNVISSQHDVIPANWIDEENMIIGRNTVNIVMHVDNKFVNVLHVQNTFLEDNIALDVMKMENDRLMELLVSQDLVHTAVNSLAVINDYESMEKSYIEEYERNLKLAAELSQMNKLLKTCCRLEQRYDDGVEEVTGMVEIAVGVTGWRWWCYGGVGGEAAGGGGGEWRRVT